jgi:hypothetical protein
MRESGSSASGRRCGPTVTSCSSPTGRPVGCDRDIRAARLRDSGIANQTSQAVAGHSGITGAAQSPAWRALAGRTASRPVVRRGQPCGPDASPSPRRSRGAQSLPFCALVQDHDRDDAASVCRAAATGTSQAAVDRIGPVTGASRGRQRVRDAEPADFDVQTANRIYARRIPAGATVTMVRRSVSRWTAGRTCQRWT